MSIDFSALLTAAAKELRADYASDPRSAWVDYMVKQAESHRRRLAYMAELLIPEQGRLLDIGFNLAFTHIYMTPSGGAKQVSLVNNGEPLADGSFRKETWRLRGRDVMCSYFDVDCHEAPLETGRFDVCVFLEILEHLPRDPMRAMSTLNRLTRTGGVLYVSTPNIVSARSLSALLSGRTPYLSSEYQRTPSPDRHNREYTPSEVVQLVEAAGFDVEWARTSSFYADSESEAWAMKAIAQSGGRTEDRGDTIIVKARKSSGVRDRYPRFLYFDA